MTKTMFLKGNKIIPFAFLSKMEKSANMQPQTRQPNHVVSLPTLFHSDIISNTMTYTNQNR